MLLFLSDPVVPLNVRKNTILLNTIKTIKLKLLTLPCGEGGQFACELVGWGWFPFQGEMSRSDKRVAVRLRICRKAIVHRPVAFGESPHPTNSQSELPTFPTRGKAFFFGNVCSLPRGILRLRSEWQLAATAMNQRICYARTDTNRSEATLHYSSFIIQYSLFISLRECDTVRLMVKNRINKGFLQKSHVRFNMILMTLKWYWNDTSGTVITPWVSYCSGVETYVKTA